nr:unnamed protein product [Spirometra erinaceieuropaei]
MVRQLQDGMMARVTGNGAINEAFAVTNGVMQGCVPAPALFPLMFFSMLMDAYCDRHPGARIAYRTDGHLLNSRRMPARMMISTTTVHDLLVADDCGLSTATEVDMQRIMDLLTDGCVYFGLTMNTDKTVVMHQTSPKPLHCPFLRITVDGHQIKTINIYIYLGSTLSNGPRVDDKVGHRISKATQAYGSLKNFVWNRHSLQLNAKLMCRAVFLTTLVYGQRLGPPTPTMPRNSNLFISTAFAEY